MEFKTGDYVFCPMYGNGEVVKIADGQIWVVFIGGQGEMFSGNEKGVLNRLYHGHDLEITIIEKPPERKKNIYLNITGSPGDYHIIEHDTLTEAWSSATVVKCAMVGIKLEVDA